jgi:SAM-dependent methyltransferase
MRVILHGLSIALWSKPLTLADFPEDRHIRGIGLSDWEIYAERLEKKLGYTNTFYHREPRLDIGALDPALEGRFDFVIASDVFEHVAPPISNSFLNVRRLLKDTGVLVFSVPFQPDVPTVEHFPELYEYSMERDSGGYVLRNRTRDGRLQEYRDLHFHGGLGSTVEMRVFGYDDLVRHLHDAGFSHLFPLNRPYFEFGIVHASAFSYPMLASPEPFRFVVSECFDWVVPGAAPRAPVEGPGVFEWGPQAVQVGESTTFWFTGQQLRSSELRVLFDGQPLADVVTSPAGDTLTSMLPEEFTRRSGQHVVEIARYGEKLFQTRFEIRPGV